MTQHTESKLKYPEGITVHSWKNCTKGSWNITKRRTLYDIKSNLSTLHQCQSRDHESNEWIKSSSLYRLCHVDGSDVITMFFFFFNTLQTDIDSLVKLKWKSVDSCESKRQQSDIVHRCGSIRLEEVHKPVTPSSPPPPHRHAQ